MHTFTPICDLFFSCSTLSWHAYPCISITPYSTFWREPHLTHFHFKKYTESNSDFHKDVEMKVLSKHGLYAHSTRNSSPKPSFSKVSSYFLLADNPKFKPHIIIYFSILNIILTMSRTPLLEIFVADLSLNFLKNRSA